MKKINRHNSFYDLYRAWNIKLDFKAYWDKVNTKLFVRQLIQKGGVKCQKQK